MASNETGLEHPHILSRRGVHGGSPVIKGTRIPISTIIIRYKQGNDVDEILRLYPQLKPAQAHDALSYYYDHREEIDREIKLLQNESSWKRKYPPGKGKLGG